MGSMVSLHSDRQKNPASQPCCPAARHAIHELLNNVEGPYYNNLPMNTEENVLSISPCCYISLRRTLEYHQVWVVGYIKNSIFEK